MCSLVWVAAAFAWNGRARAQTAAPASQKPALDPAASVLSEVFTDAPQVGGTVAPAPEAASLPPTS